MLTKKGGFTPPCRVNKGRPSKKVHPRVLPPTGTTDVRIRSRLMLQEQGINESQWLRRIRCGDTSELRFWDTPLRGMSLGMSP